MQKQQELDRESVQMLLAFGSDQIQKAGILLQLHAVTIASGQSILHKFYVSHNLKEYNIKPTSAACCFLACKLEENHRKLEQVAKIFEFLRYYEDESKSYKYSSENENILKKEILRIEREILVGFAFRLDKIMVLPHRYILQYTYALFRNLDKYTSHSVDKLAQRAWGYLNDSMRTSLCCEIRPGVIAAGCIYLSATSLGIPLKKETEWFQVFEATWEEIIKVCKEMDRLYAMGKPKYIEV
ncbi:cyclin [Theileria orientalis strain Shintoku]|uniref:Cyclin n=1 Tax=Theileria orientalis strain Shintoku TaxID=869250 RepID=J4CCN5_THEOR|nr:cyclin [Theileria orientalis strain Shintoku]PVC52471.1 cyclin [Theileria orientalis]BAM39702.1 cyclin [Theileria orientalis strain Shintoku]|eukprot:XP_009690003.1 cyclin [Theileria orientalis strain Shintoku]